MIKVSVLYPNNEGSKFDIDYYCKKHIPMVQQKLGSACKSVDVEQGISGPTPGSRPAYVAIGHLYFESVPEFQAAFGPHSKEIMGDIPNYTNLQPIIQVSEVKL
jgi:uncharacterized protein (TIGR02118 family)